ncbi:ABC transporter substrate-binding protein [bacterium]|nr:ABC transporter substrate-binding protein [bacterium]
MKKDDFSTKPQLNNGKKWRVGYLEGGPFIGYPLTLKALVQGLSELGWVEETQFPAKSDEAATKDLWSWMANHVNSQYIEFAADAYWSNGWDNAILRPKTRMEIIERLNVKKDIDLMIAMGTWAGQDLATDEHSVPTIVVAARNPVLSGIIKSAEDSGHDHVHARLDSTRYERQVRQFHDIFNFKRLGIVFDRGTTAGRNYAGIAQIEKVAAERGIVVVSCDAPSIQVSREVAEQTVIECYQKLAPKVDAVYITTHRGVTLRNLPKILTPINKYNRPSYSQSISLEVRHGVLMSNAEAGFQFVGHFYAQTIAQIFNGANPGDLPQIFEDPNRLAINMKTAKMIGYAPTKEVMQATDEVYN